VTIKWMLFQLLWQKKSSQVPGKMSDRAYLEVL
jgi:hypothetical protein